LDKKLKAVPFGSLRRFNLFETIFAVLSKNFEVFQHFAPATAVSRPLHGVKKLQKRGEKPLNPVLSM
jgi:hypothetical protein